MKNKLNFIIAIFAMLIFSSLAAAQGNEDIEKRVESAIQRPPQQRISRTAEIEAFKPVQCVLGLQQTFSAGIYDNITLPTEPTFKSPALLAAFPPSVYSYKDFDDKAVNKLVGQSFMLKNYKPCEGRMCSVLLEIQVCNSGADLWTNDKIYVGAIEGNKMIPSILYADIWKPNEANKCKNISIPIAPSVVASWSTLEVLIQDDTTVDNMKLTLNY